MLSIAPAAHGIACWPKLSSDFMIDDDYDPISDIWASVDYAYQVIRERKANGGAGWIPKGGETMADLEGLIKRAVWALGNPYHGDLVKARMLRECVEAIQQQAQEIETLKAAARRLLPADGYMTDGMPDDRPVNLMTTMGALRQFAEAFRIESDSVA